MHVERTVPMVVVMIVALPDRFLLRIFLIVIVMGVRLECSPFSQGLPD